MTRKKMSEDEALAHITRLRDSAINLVRENGQWERVGAMPVMGIKDHGNLAVLYLTPFQRPKNAPKTMGYALSIAIGRRVLLSLLWNETGPLTTEIYRPGAWEAKLAEPALTVSLAA